MNAVIAEAAGAAQGAAAKVDAAGMVQGAVGKAVTGDVTVDADAAAGQIVAAMAPRKGGRRKPGDRRTERAGHRSAEGHAAAVPTAFRRRANDDGFGKIPDGRTVQHRRSVGPEHCCGSGRSSGGRRAERAAGRRGLPSRRRGAAHRRRGTAEQRRLQPERRPDAALRRKTKQSVAPSANSAPARGA